MKKTKIICLLQISVLIYSLGSIASKLASNEPIFSRSFIIYSFILFVLLAIYSIVWQQILKHTSLSFAYINKATSIIWGLVFGYFFFNEQISLFNIIGALIVIAGIVLVFIGDKGNE